jgi:hypothetical protein
MKPGNQRGIRMNIEMNKVLVNAYDAYGAHHYEYTKYELIEPFRYCCARMKSLIDDRQPFDLIEGKLNWVFTIDQGDHASTYDYFPFDFCPFCGEKIDYEIIKSYIDTPVYVEREIQTYKSIVEKKPLFERFERTEVKK